MQNLTVALIMENNSINHTGIVQSVDGHEVTVKLTVQSACAACHAKSICGVSDSKDKIVKAAIVCDEQFEVGEKITVEMRQSLAMKAIVICYLLPFIVLITTFCVMSYFCQNELVNVLVTFAAVAAYFFFIWLFNHKIERNVTFIAVKLTENSENTAI